MREQQATTTSPSHAVPATMQIVSTAKSAAEPQKANRFSPGKTSRIWLPVLAGLAFAALWEGKALHSLFGLKTYQLPVPSAIAQAAIENADILTAYAGYTLTEAVLGMLLGSFIGFVIAVTALAWPKWASGSIMLVAALNAIPIVALAPIMNLWFGGGIGSRIAIVTVTTMAAMVINAHKGMSMVDPLALDLMHSYAAK